MFRPSQSYEGSTYLAWLLLDDDEGLVTPLLLGIGHDGCFSWPGTYLTYIKLEAFQTGGSGRGGEDDELAASLTLSSDEALDLMRCFTSR
jgi:hypothetical protein